MPSISPSRFFPLLLIVLVLSSCAPQPTKEVPAEFKKGQEYFHGVCSNCHGSDAMGGHTKAPRLIDAEYLAPNFTDEDIRDTALNGTGKMPPQKANVTADELTEIIKYIRYSQKAANLVAEADDDPEEEEEEE